MAGKQKYGGARAKGSGGMRFCHTSAPLCKKYGDAGFNLDQLSNETITSECTQVFSCCLREASGYKCTHADFPGTTFLVAKNDFLVTAEVEAPFDSEVVKQPPPHPPAQEQAVEATMAAEKIY